MVKETTNAHKIKSNPINRVQADNKTQAKSKKEINSSYYQKNKAKLRSQRRDNYQQEKETEKAKRKERYAQKKTQEQLLTKQTQAKYYQAEAIKILMSFKEYTELNKEKMQLWKDFNWTFQDCQKSFSEGYVDIVMIMKWTQVADNLIRDYRETAKTEERQLSKNWNSLSEEEQSKLIRYWGYEKARIENGYLDEAERLEKQSHEYLKEIELAKFHEQRGKEKCPCYQCQESKRIQVKIKQELNSYDQAIRATDKEPCPECGKLKVLDEESEVCKSCKKKYE